MVTRGQPQDGPGVIYVVGTPVGTITAPEGTIAFNITSAPYTMYVFLGGAWNQAGGGGVNSVVGVGAGYKIARGQMTTATATDTVVTGLATVVSAVANMEDAPVIGADRANATIGDQAGAPAAGSIVIKSF